MTTAKTRVLPLAPPIALEMMLISAGEFKMGHDLQIVYLPEYYIAKYPVTVAQFTIFVRESQYQTTAEKEDGGGEVFNGEEWEYRGHVAWKHPRGKWMGGIALKQDHPITQVSWDDAMAFCLWVSEKTKVNVRLPTNEEWEKAARGTDGRRWPWGNEWPHSFVWGEQDTHSVGKYEGFESPYGCVDMAINVKEFAGTANNRCIRGVVNNRYQASLADCPQYDKYSYLLGFRVCASVEGQ